VGSDEETKEVLIDLHRSVSVGEDDSAGLKEGFPEVTGFQQVK